MASLSTRAIAKPQPAATPVAGALRVAAVYWPLLPVLLGVTLLALPTLAYPFGPDQAIFATIGRAINQGRFPYVDAWDQKPPAIYLLYALALRLPGPMMQRVRLFDLLWTLATMIALYEMARTFWNIRAATFASLLYGAIYFTTQGWWYLAQPDGLMGLPLLVAMLLYLRAGGRRGPLLLIASGALAGLAFQLRFNAAPILPLFVVACPALWRRNRLVLVRQLLWMGVGFSLVQAALVLYLAAGHAFHAYLEATQFATEYARLGWPFAPEPRTFVGFLHHVRGALQLFAAAHIALVMPAMALVFTGLFIAPDSGTRRIALVALVAYAGILAQQKFFWYHWQLLLPYLALLAGRAWDGMFRLIETAAGRGWREVTAKCVLVVGMALATSGVLDYGYAQWDDLLHRNDSPVARLRRDNQFGPYGDGTYSYLADLQVADYLRARTRPGESVYVFGYDPLIYLLSDRASASRFIYSLPLMSYWAPPRWQDEFLAEIDRSRPVYFILQRNEGAARWITGQTEDTAAWAWKLPGVAGRLEREYELEIEIEDFALYRRRSN
jgi:hypothetical protein